MIGKRIRGALAGLSLAVVTLAAGGVAAASSSWPGAAVGVRSDAEVERPLTLPARLPTRELRVPILMYHRVNAAPPPSQRPLTVHPGDFACQMRWLKQQGYRTITQRELYDALFLGKRLGPKPILITFDDGYSDVFHKALPVLKRLDMGATAYVISGRTLKSDTVFLTWHLLRALERDGVEIGSHTVDHRDLTSLSDGEALRELVQSRRTLERRLRHPIPWLAYPFGSYDARIERLARRAGYVLAVTTEHGVVHSARRPLALRRLRVLDSTGVAGLATMLGGR